MSEETKLTEEQVREEYRQQRKDTIRSREVKLG